MQKKNTTHRIICTDIDISCYIWLYTYIYIVHAYARESKYIRMYEEYGNDFLL